MNLNNNTIKIINDNLIKSSDFKLNSGLKDLTLLDVFALIKRKTRHEHNIYNKNYIK